MVRLILKASEPRLLALLPRVGGAIADIRRSTMYLVL